MVLVLSNEDVERVLTIQVAIEALRSAYADLAKGSAINRTRSDVLIPLDEQATYAFKSMEGTVVRERVHGLRINSDVINWPEREGVVRREKVPTAPGQRWVGLIQLYSIDDGRLLAIMPDGVLQRMRVGATNGLALDYLARRDANTIGILGSGWQAGAQLMAACALRPIRAIRVYSPTGAHRERFADEMAELLGVQVQAVPSPEAAVEGADVVMLATNALAPLYPAEWIVPGVFVTCVRNHEISPEAYRAFDLVIINTRQGQPDHYLLGQTEENVPELRHGWAKMMREVPWNAYAELSELVASRVEGRTDDRQSTCYSNNLGLGFQFAAVGAAVLNRARELGLGHELPDDWFTQTVHP